MSSERQLDDTNNPWWGEHLHRYEVAANLLPKKDSELLDIACGSGFGSNYLAKLGHKVIGADLSEDTIKDCIGKFDNKEISFRVIDGTKMDFDDHVFDAVISFETIEHTTQYQQMLNEFKRVVKKDGLIIISTPNFLINSPGGKLLNPYHTQEWIYEDLLELLNSTFSSVKIFGQEYSRYKNKHSFRYKAAKLIELFLYCRGIRKLPVSLQDTLMKLLIRQPMYPLSSNYIMTDNVDEIKKCKTFFI